MHPSLWIKIGKKNKNCNETCWCGGTMDDLLQNIFFLWFITDFLINKNWDYGGTEFTTNK